MYFLASYRTSQDSAWNSPPQVPLRQWHLLPGALVLWNWDTRKRVHQWELPSPAGFALRGETLYVASMLANHITAITPGYIRHRAIMHRWFSDLHHLSATPRGLLCVSSGTDSVLELSEDGHVCWFWHAPTHYPEVLPLRLRGHYYASPDETLAVHGVPQSTKTEFTHCNSALVEPIDRESWDLFISLFHQGQIVRTRFTRGTPGTTEVVLDGLQRPHSIRRYGNGYLLCNSEAGELLVLDAHWRIVQRIPIGTLWIQDALPLSETHILVADANSSQFLIWNRHTHWIEEILPYPAAWKIYQLDWVPDAVAERWLAVSHWTESGPGGWFRDGNS